MNSREMRDLREKLMVMAQSRVQSRNMRDRGGQMSPAFARQSSPQMMTWDSNGGAAKRLREGYYINKGREREKEDLLGKTMKDAAPKLGNIYATGRVPMMPGAGAGAMDTAVPDTIDHRIGNGSPAMARQNALDPAVMAQMQEDSYYENPDLASWQRLPMTRDTGIYRTQFGDKNSNAYHRSQADFEKAGVDIRQLENDYARYKKSIISNPERYKLSDGQEETPETRKAWADYVAGENAKASAKMVSKHGEDWQNLVPQLEAHAALREKNRDSFGGGFSNIGSREVVNRQPEKLSPKQILANQSARMKGFTDTMGALNPAKSSNDIINGLTQKIPNTNLTPGQRIKQSYKITNKFVPELQQPKAIRRPSNLPSILGKGDPKERRYNEQGAYRFWDKDEYVAQREKVNKDTAQEYFDKVKNVNWKSRDEFNSFLNEMHPDIRNLFIGLVQADAGKKQVRADKNIAKIKNATPKEPTDKGWAGAIPNAVKKSGLWDIIKEGRDELRTRKRRPKNSIPPYEPAPEQRSTIARNDDWLGGPSMADEPYEGSGLKDIGRFAAKSARGIKQALNSDMLENSPLSQTISQTQFAPQGRPFDAARTALAPTRMEQAQLNATTDIINILSEINTGALAETDGMKAINAWIDYLESAMGPEQAQQALMQIIDKVSTKSPLQPPSLMPR